jgi:O-antigen ligase
MNEAARGRAAAVSRQAAGVAFSVLVIVSPFRARIELLGRRTTPIYGEYTDFLLYLSDLAMLATIGLWLLGVALGRQHRGRRVVGSIPRFITWPMVTVLGMAVLSIPFAIDPTLATYTTIRLIVLAVLATYVANEIDQLGRMVLPVALMVFVQAMVGIGQVVGQHSLSLGVLGEHALAPSLGVSVVTAKDGTRLVRAYGLTDHPNILGGLLVFGLLIVAGGLASRASTARRALSAYAMLLALGTIATLLTFSRSAWLALITGLTVLGGMHLARGDRRALRRLVAACAVGFIAAAPFVAAYRPALGARTQPSSPIATEARSVNERVALTRATTTIIARHPLLGVGIGTLPLAIQADHPAFTFTYQPASVVLLDVAAELGLFGGAAYLVLLLSPWLALVRRRPRWTPDLAVASALLASLTVVGLFDHYPWAYSAGRIWAWLIPGLWVAAYRRAMACPAPTAESADVVATTSEQKPVHAL